MLKLTVVRKSHTVDAHKHPDFVNYLKNFEENFTLVVQLFEKGEARRRYPGWSLSTKLAHFGEHYERRWR